MVGEGSEKGQTAGPAAGERRAPLPSRLLDEANDAVLVTEGGPLDEPGPRVVYANAAFSRTTGYSSEEIVGRSPRVLQGPGTDRAELDGIRAALEAGRAVRTEVLNYRKDGEAYWVELDIVPVRDDAGRIGRWLSVQRDTTGRVEAEGARVETERRLRAVLARYGSDMVTILEPDGTPRYESPAVERALGYRHKELAEGDVFRFVHPDDVEALGRSVEEALRKPGESPPVEFRMRHADGSWRWFESSKNNLSGDPDVGGVVVVTRDVTGRKEAERALRGAEERYRLLVEQIPAVTYIDRYVDPHVDGPDEPVYVSPQIEAMLGYTPEEWIGKGLWHERLHPEDRGRVLAADGRFEGGEDERFSEEYRLLAKNGRPMWVREEAAAVRDGEGRPLFWQGVMLDVTERREAERRLEQSGERFRALVQNASDIITLLDAAGTILYESPSVERVLGHPPEGLVGRNALDYVHPEDAGRVRRGLRRAGGPRASGAGAGPPVEYRVLHGDGSWRRVESVATNLLSDPAVGGIVVNTRDVTERRRLEERLAHQAYHDPLTGLPNRALLRERFARAAGRADRDGKHLAVLYLDLDGFKALNDSLGHGAGDGLLVAVAERLAARQRSGDTVARLGGDEFCVLAEGIDGPPQEARVSGRVRDALREPFAVGGRRLRTSASIGAAVRAPGEDRPLDRLLREADAAMYRAKKEKEGPRRGPAG